jgi:hypothetical protein
MKYADELMPLATEEVVLQGMTDELTEIGRSYGMGTKVEKKLR